MIFQKKILLFSSPNILRFVTLQFGHLIVGIDTLDDKLIRYNKTRFS